MGHFGGGWGWGEEEGREGTLKMDCENSVKVTQSW